MSLSPVLSPQIPSTLAESLHRLSVGHHFHYQVRRHEAQSAWQPITCAMSSQLIGRRKRK